MLKAIIFDFDGVIVDTERDRFNFLQKELLTYKIIIDNSKFPLFLGRKTTHVLKELIPNIDNKILIDIDKKRQKYIKNNITKLKPLSNLNKILRLLYTRHKLAITTGSKKITVNKFLIKHDLKKYFKHIISGEQFRSSKPDAECYKITLQKLSVKPSEVVIIEDSEAGVIAAKKLGCQVFGIQNKYNKNQLKGTDKTFRNYKEMNKYFRKSFSILKG